MQRIICNGKLMDAGTAVAGAASRGLRYGEGCFETMRIWKGRLVLRDQHFERLFRSIETLQLQLPAHVNAQLLEEQLLMLAAKNGHGASARIRLNIIGGDGGLFECGAKASWLIESFSLEESTGHYNNNGLVLDVYQQGRKSCDLFSGIKSNSSLLYAMAAKWARQQQCNDAVILNSFDRIAETSISNLFLVKDGIITTPALAEGCVAGVMRQFIIHSCRQQGIPVQETAVTINDLQAAAEIFISNAIKGIRWVARIGNNHYRNDISRMLHQQFILPLWQ